MKTSQATLREKASFLSVECHSCCLCNMLSAVKSQQDEIHSVLNILDSASRKEQVHYRTNRSVSEMASASTSRYLCGYSIDL